MVLFCNSKAIMVLNKWVPSGDNVSYAQCEQQRHRSDCADQPAHPRSLISDFVVCSLLASLWGWAVRFESYLEAELWRQALSWRGSRSQMIILAQYCILNQINNAIRKWLHFCMNMWCRTLYLRYIAQQLIKNLWCTVSNVSTARFAEL